LEEDVDRDRRTLQGGFLATQLYVLFTTPTSGIENLEQHLDYQQLLERGA
jgi:hypothetical protein